MHYLLGLAALVIGVVIATRRTRPRWFVVVTSVLVAVGALLAILSYTRVTDSLGLLPNSIIGWIYVGLSIITMLSAVFVLERRGARGEELPPLIGDNPFDGDTDDADDPVVGGARATSQDGVLGSDADVMAGDAAAPLGSPLLSHPTLAGDAAHTTDARHTTGAHASAPTGRTAAPHGASAAMTTSTHTEGMMTDSTTPNGTQGDADAEAREDGTATSHPGPSAGAQDGTESTGSDPDIATEALEAETDAAPDGLADGRSS